MRVGVSDNDVEVPVKLAGVFQVVALSVLLLALMARTHGKQRQIDLRNGPARDERRLVTRR
jgi:hypothetical protein